MHTVPVHRTRLIGPLFLLLCITEENPTALYDNDGKNGVVVGSG
jgi:hypothetical protein